MSPWVRFVEKLFRLPHRREELRRVETAAERLGESLDALRAELDPVAAIAMHHTADGDEE